MTKKYEVSVSLQQSPTVNVNEAKAKTVNLIKTKLPTVEAEFQKAIEVLVGSGVINISSPGGAAELDPRGATLTYSEDQETLLRVDYTDGNYREFTYDDNGNLIRVDGSDSSFTLAYNDQNCLISKTLI